MVYDIPSVAAAMDRKILQLDHITNNLANAATPGFKAQHLHALKTLEEETQTAESVMSSNILVKDFSQGMTQKTDNPLDLSIHGDGFFVVQTHEGQVFTRKGDFTVNKLSQIVAPSGDPVVGEGGLITVKNGKIHISNDGSVYVDENQVGKLKMVDFSNRQALESVGAGMYRDPGTGGIKKLDKPNVCSGQIELSNVNIIREMTAMIDIQRSFETYQKVMQTLADDDKLSTSRIGRVG